MHRRLLEPHAPRGQRVLRTDHDAIRLGAPLRDVRRPGGRESGAAPLAHGVVVLAVVPAEDGAARVDDVAGRPEPGPAVALEERAAAEAGHEAEVLALALVGHRQAGL